MKLGISPCSRGPQATHLFSRHLMLACVGFWECRARGRFIKNLMLELAPGVKSWFQRKLRKKIAMISSFHISVRIQDPTNWIYFLEMDPEISFQRLGHCFKEDLGPCLTHTHSLGIGLWKPMPSCVSTAENKNGLWALWRAEDSWLSCSSSPPFSKK